MDPMWLLGCRYTRTYPTSSTGICSLKFMDYLDAKENEYVPVLRIDWFSDEGA